MFLYYFSVSVIFVLVSLLLSVFDVKFQKIPLIPVFCGIFLILICHFVFNLGKSYLFVLSGLLNFLIYFMVRKISGNKLGSGDVYFALFCGVIIKPLFLWLFMLFNVLFTLPFFIKKSGSFKLPFIPFMAAACCICLILTFIL